MDPRGTREDRGDREVSPRNAVALPVGPAIPVGSIAPAPPQRALPPAPPPRDVRTGDVLPVPASTPTRPAPDRTVDAGGVVSGGATGDLDAGPAIAPSFPRPLLWIGGAVLLFVLLRR